MKRRRKIIVAVATLLAAGLACNLPNRNAQPTPSQPTPNMTMTALFNFSTPVVSKPTITPRPSATAATPSPTETRQQPATNTPYTPPTATTGIPIVQPTFLNPLVTATVTPTAEPRKAGMVSAFYLKEPPKLDGIWDEWPIAAHPATWVVWGRNNWTGKADFEGSYRIGWDEDNLYLALKVYDDVYVQEGSGRDIYKGDSFELLFDRELAGDINSQELNGDDYQIIISPGRGGPMGPVEAYRYNPKDLESKLDTVSVVCRYENAIHRCEVVYPWSVLGVTYPERGQEYGFAFSPSDNDSPGEMVQQTVISNTNLRKLTDPTTWLQLILK